MVFIKHIDINLIRLDKITLEKYKNFLLFILHHLSIVGISIHSLSKKYNISCVDVISE